VRADLQGVGADVSIRTYNMKANGLRAAKNLLRWLGTGRAPAASPYPHAVAFERLRPEEPQPDLQLLFEPFAFGCDENGVSSVAETGGDHHG
jgi:hypothetical protein